MEIVREDPPHPNPLPTGEREQAAHAAPLPSNNEPL